MSNINRNILNAEVIPSLRSSVFSEHPNARFAAGIIARNGMAVPGFEHEYSAHFALRRHVYVEQTGQLTLSDLDRDGRDVDSDDYRSVTFAVFENQHETVRVVGVSRLIFRGQEQKLPAEELFPEAFATRTLSDESCEVSRVIARHERASVQNIVLWHLFTQMLAFVSTQTASNTEGTYAIIEPWLERYLHSIIAITRISDPIFVSHYHDENLPVEIDIVESTKLAASKVPGLFEQYQRSSYSISYFGRAALLSLAETP